MATVITRYFDHDAAGANDGTSWTDAYTTIGGAFSDIVSDYPNFVTSDVIVTLNCRGSGAETITVSVLFTSTTDATRYLRVTGDNDFPADGVFDTAKLYFDCSDLSDSQFDHGGNKIQFDHLQFQANESITYVEIHKDDGGGSGELIVNACIYRWLDGTADGEIFRLLNANSVLTVTNTVFYDEAGRILESGSTGAKKFTNCTFHGNSGIWGGGGTAPIFKNCLWEDNTDPASVGSGSDYNSTDGSAPTNWGSNSLNTQNVTFTDQTGKDFSLAAGDTALHSAGIGTTDSDVPSTDIIGTARGSANCSIGALEYVSSGSIAPLANHHLRQMAG